MHQMNSFESDGQKESSFVFLQILPENPSLSSSPIYTQELAQKIFTLSDFSTLAQSFQDPGCPQLLIGEGKVDSGTSDSSIGVYTGINNAEASGTTTHVEILHNSLHNAPPSKLNLSKVEGRKAPGSNRILPLITSVWEDGDLLRKRHKSPKGSKKESRGKGSRSSKRTGHRDVDIDEVSDDEDWLEHEEKDFHGGNLHTAYSHFFMAEEGGEDREDCICGDCGAEFLTANQVAHHLQTEHHKIGVKLHQCFVCKRKRYPAIALLNHHLSNAHGIPRPELTCRTCFMELAGISEAKAHSRKHETPYKCSKCSQSHLQMGPHTSIPRFSTRFLLAEHLREIHLPKERPFPCDKCGRQFLHQFVRDLHLQRSHNGSALVCPEIRLSDSFVTYAQNPAVDHGDCEISHASSAVGDSLVSASCSTESLSGIGTYLEGVVSGHGEKDARVTSSDLDNSLNTPSNLQVAVQPGCSKGIFSFRDEVSLLRHVFQCHEKTIRIQLLKWAREADREDALLDELWKAYLKNSNTGNIATARNEVNSTSNEGVQSNEVFHDVSLATSSTPSNMGTSSNMNISGVAQGNLPGFAQCSSLFLSPDLSSTSATISISRTQLSSDGFIKVSLPSMPQVSQCDNVALSLSDPSLSFTNVQSPMATVSHKSLDSSDNQFSIPNTESNEIVSLTVGSESVPGISCDGVVSEIVSGCMENILDSICSVLDKRSAYKEAKKPAAMGGIQKHMMSVRCVLCRYLACNAMALERHRRRRHFRNRHCPFCSLACASVDSVWKHVSEVHLDSTETSKDANGLCSADGDLQNQTQSQKPSQSSSGLRCPVCKKVFSSRGKCNSHQESVHKVEVVTRHLSCDICSKKFQFQRALERHKLLHGQGKDDDGASGTLKCPHCDQTFLRPGFLHRHIASHFENYRKNGVGGENGRMGHPCPSCPRRLSTPAKLKAHLRTSHPPSHLKQRFTCSQCPVRCSTASGLRVHLRVHSGERPFPCQLCSATFKRQTALKKHIVALHPVSPVVSSGDTGNRESFLKCPNCSSVFRDRSNLVRHFLQVHRGLRRFVCGLCGSRYGQNQDLRRHLKINHKMEAPRIIGSDRRSVDQIYVVPPVMESLPANHPLVDKIRMIVEEEERKLSEDFLPQFTSTPQQLHLQIHKDGATLSEMVTEADQDDQANSNRDAPGGSEAEKGDNDDWNTFLISHSSLIESKRPEGLKVGKENSLLSESWTKSSHQKFGSGDGCNSTDINYYANRSGSTGSRNLILDALISSQIAIDSTETNVIPTEENGIVQNIVGRPLEMVKEVEDTSCKGTDGNLIASHDPTTSNSHFTVNKSTSEDNRNVRLGSISGESSKKKAPYKKSSLVQGNYLCGQCGKEFLDSSRYARHCKTHSGKKPHICSVCGKSFVERFNLKVHMRSHTGERPYKCEDCGKAMRYLKELTDHRRMHLGERPYMCDICSKTFLRMRELKRHSLVHSNEKKHKCPICGKAFSRLDHLRTAHMRVHEHEQLSSARALKGNRDSGQSGSQKNNSKEMGEKYRNKRREASQNQRYSCRKCTKQFSSKAKLNQHIILHSGQKEHKCTICGRSFALQSYLRAHLNIHRKQEGYLQCPKCPRKFSTAETLSVHEEKFHGRIEKMKKFPSPELNAGKNKDSSIEFCDEEKFFMTRPGDFDVNLDLEDDMNIQEVEFFNPASLSEAERQNTFVYLHVVSDELQLSNEPDLLG